MAKITRRLFGQLAEVILEGGAKQATKYVSESLTVKATFQGRRFSRRGHATVLFTVGRPNYAERQFIRKYKRAGEPFPVKRLQLRWPPKGSKRATA